MLVQTRVELLDVQQGLLVHKLQELLGLLRHLEENNSVYIRITAPRTIVGRFMVVMDDARLRILTKASASSADFLSLWTKPG